MINELIKLATHLDKKGLTKEADYLDGVIKREAGLLTGGLSGLIHSWDTVMEHANKTKQKLYWVKDRGDDGQGGELWSHDGETKASNVERRKGVCTAIGKKCRNLIDPKTIAGDKPVYYQS
jgi:hypothetical protein